MFSGGTLTPFVDTILNPGCQKVAPVEIWDKAASQIKAWEIFCAVLLCAADTHPTTTKMIDIV